MCKAAPTQKMLQDLGFLDATQYEYTKVVCVSCVCVCVCVLRVCVCVLCVCVSCLKYAGTRVVCVAPRVMPHVRCIVS